MPSSSRDSLPPAFRETLTERDIKKNSTLQSFDRISGQLDRLYSERESINKILDIGCGRGGFIAALGNHLEASEIYGIDIDENKREKAAERGVTTFDTNVDSEPLPFEDGTIDVVVSFGLIEHLKYYSKLLEETARVLENGWFWLAAPNLASWINRLALLFGYQPRNVEISRKHAAGTLPVYDSDSFLNHVSAPTYKALIGLLEHHGFEPIDSVALSPYQRSRLDRTLDRIFNMRTGLGRRVAVLSRLE